MPEFGGSPAEESVFRGTREHHLIPPPSPRLPVVGSVSLVPLNITFSNRRARNAPPSNKVIKPCNRASYADHFRNADDRFRRAPLPTREPRTHLGTITHSVSRRDHSRPTHPLIAHVAEPVGQVVLAQRGSPAVRRKS